MIPGASRAATAALAGALLTFAFCSSAGAEPVTKPTTRQVVLIGSAKSVQSSSVIQSANVRPAQQAAVPGARELPHTGTAPTALTLLGFALVLLGALALRGQQPQLRLAARS